MGHNYGNALPFSHATHASKKYTTVRVVLKHPECILAACQRRPSIYSPEADLLLPKRGLDEV